MMMTNDPDKVPYTNYGWANSWDLGKEFRIPVTIKNCHHGHPDKEYKKVGKCVTKVICHACRFTYLIDSSG